MSGFTDPIEQEFFVSTKPGQLHPIQGAAARSRQFTPGSTDGGAFSES